jgi:antitoxin component YwqK of YwqJK toxin-antitoxin module
MIIDNIFLITILIWFNIPSSAQNIVQVSDTLKHVNLIENYEAIRRGDHYTNHGKYSMVNHEKKIVIKGNYHQGSKNGFWEYFDVETLKVLAEGNYTNNSFTGTWEFYYSNGETRLIYDFEADNIVYYDNIQDNDFTSIQSIHEDGLEPGTLERFPTYAYPWSPRTYLILELKKRGISLNTVNSNGQIKILVDMFGYMKIMKIETHNELILDSLVDKIMFSYKSLWIPAIIDNMMTEVIIFIKF